MTTDDESAGLGEAWIDPVRTVIAGEIGTWRVSYRAGARGIAEGGRLGFAWLWPCDWERPQFDRPAGSGYASLATTGACRLSGSFARDPAMHPWDHVTTVKVTEAPLQPGELIQLTLGDTRQGSPGSRAQTFQENECAFHMVVDPSGSGRWLPLSTSPTLKIVGGPVERLIVVAPTDVVAGEAFDVTIRAEDLWNNPSASYEGTLSLVFSLCDPVITVRVNRADRGVTRIRVKLDRSGVVRPAVTDDRGRSAEGNPIVCHADKPRFRRYWGDPHSGQSRAGCGAGSVEEHFRFMRDVAAVDFGTHQGNCFMVSNEDWAETCRVSREFNHPGRFVAFLGYEWSGASDVGGDHNVLFLDDDQPIRRCSHDLLTDHSDIDTDLPHITDVYDYYAGKRVLLVPHVGGRPSDLTYHSPELEPVMEIHSGHGTHEWFLADALARGYRVGFTSGSDDVMGRPGANYPGFADGRNTRGGLTAVYAMELTREGIYEALKARRTYATTGERMAIWMEADGHPLGSAYETATPPHLHCDIWSTAGLERVELFRGSERIYSAPVIDRRVWQPNVLRIAWTGASARGTGGESKLRWDGELTLDRGRIVSARSHGFDSASDAILTCADQLVRWRSVTALDSDGIVITYDAPEDTRMTFQSPSTTFTFRPDEVMAEPLIVEAGPVDRRVTVSRLPVVAGPREYHVDFTDDQFPEGTSAYFARAIQDDDEKAWTSPIYVTRTSAG
ncbi:MAG TPA: DUF3604 domain-containing protein [Thermomicrobiales bacterium]|nr:DUF3604 domain-containing protein [Thermomicrobiales bacterium]